MAAVLQACSLLVQALDAYHDIARTSPAWRSAVRPCWRAWSALVSLARRAVCGGLMWAAGCGS